MKNLGILSRFDQMVKNFEKKYGKITFINWLNCIILIVYVLIVFEVGFFNRMYDFHVRFVF
jgi:hypothetical protein